MKRKVFSKFAYFIFLTVLVIASGTIGYMIIEGWNFVDSLYMSLITVSTVGFREVNELSVYGKLFTSFLIVSGFGTFAYALTTIARYIVGGEYRRYLREVKMLRETRRMENHVIICGFGRVGMQVASDLLSHDDEFVIIERSDEIINQYSASEDYLFMKGDSTDDEVLVNAGINNARAIITCLPKDADNIYVVLAAREHNKEILIVSRASQGTAVSKLRMAGANNVIMPDSIGGSHMASLIANPDVMEFLDIVRVQGNEGSNMSALCYDQLPSEFKNMTIGEMENQQITGVTIIGYKTPAGEYVINPNPETKVVDGTKVFVLGNSAQIKSFKNHFGIKR